MASHLTAPPPLPSITNPGVPSGFDAVIATGMAKDPDERYPTTVELARAAWDAITTPMARPSPEPQLPPTQPAPVRVPLAARDEPKRPPGGLDPAAASRQRSSADANHRAPQPLSASRAPVVEGSTPRPWWRRKAAVISAAIALVPVAVQRRWQTSSWFVAALWSSAWPSLAA